LVEGSTARSPGLTTGASGGYRQGVSSNPMDPGPDPRAEGQDESVNPPHRDDDPPRREASSYIWLIVIGLVALSFVVLFIAYAVIVAR
jgi:hypothetical protein